MRTIFTLIALLMATVAFCNERSDEELIRRTAEVACERKIPLIQVAYKTPERHLFFESSQVDEIKPDPEAQTIFQAASISKVVFSYIVLRLVDMGIIDLDKPLYKYMGKKPDARFCNAFETRAENKENIRRAKMLTARIVLNHRTGLPNWAKGTGPRRERPLIFKCEPGEKYTYSGEGIDYLQRVVEHITGMSLEELARREVFDPLGMDNTSYRWLPQYDKMAAYGYNKDGVRRGRGNTKVVGDAAFSMRTNVRDFSLFLDALMVGRGLSPESFKMMTSSLMPAPKEDTCFGLGIRVTKNADHPRDEVWHHGGSNPNFRCRFMLFPERKSYLIFFTNSVYGAGKTRKMMLDTFYPDYRGVDF